jgi:hypothetical protein
MPGSGAECCKGTVWVPFAMIRAAHPHWPLATVTLDDVGQKLRCHHCGGRPRQFYPARQDDAQGYGGPSEPKYLLARST